MLLEPLARHDVMMRGCIRRGDVEVHGQPGR